MIKMYFNSLKGACFLLLSLLLVSSAVQAQTTHNVTNVTPNSLETFIETGTWAAGDIIMLTSPGIYEVADIIDVNKSVTIMGDPVLSSRPVINFTTANNTIRANADDLSITIKGIDFNGYRENNTNRANAIFRANSTVERVTSLVLEDSKAWGFIAGVDLNTTNFKTVYDRVLINNVDWGDFGGSTSVYAINLRLSAVKDFRVANSTFHKLQLGFISPPYFSQAPARPTKILQHYLIENNTFYKVAGQNNGSLIQFNDPNDNSIKLTFRNNIVSMLFNPLIARPFRINAAAGQPEEGGVKPIQIVNNLFHDYNSPHQEGVHNLSTVAARPDANVVNNITANPLFLDPENGIFTLLPGSPARTASTDGGPVGDMQWVGGVHRITNAADNSIKTFVENTALWSSGDIILLVSAGTYNETGRIAISQDVTIMGDPALTSRPLVKVSGVGNGGAFVPVADNLSIVLKDFNFDGRSLNATNAEQKAILIGYASGAANAMGGKLIKVENMNASGMTQGIELYPGGSRIYDKVLINNVNWNDITQWIFYPRINAVRELSITNSTFSNAGGFINNFYFRNTSNRLTAVPQKVVVNNNTFYNIADGNRALLQINDGDDSSVNLTFTNNIVSKLKDPNNARPFLFFENKPSGTYTLSNNVFHDFVVTEQTRLPFNLSVVSAFPFFTVANNTTDNPNFTNPAELNFKLPNGSPLATAGIAGGVIGDPDWAPDNVTSTKPELAAAKVEVYPNPVRDVLYINAPTAVEVTIYNIAGSAVLKEKVDRNGSIKIAGIKPGLYIARINSGNNVQTVKILKQ